MFSSWNTWIRCPGRAASAANRLKARCLLMGKHLVLRKTLMRFSSRTCLDCPTPASEAMTKTSCSKISCCLCTEIKQDQLKANDLRSPIHVQEQREPSLPHTLNMSKRKNICHGETQDILDRCSNSTGLPIPHLSDLKSHKNRIPVICNYPGAQILWMKGSLT